MLGEKKRIRGMTLPEVLVAAIIGALLMGAFVGIWQFVTRTSSVEQTRTALRVELESVMERIKSEIRLSSLTFTSFFSPAVVVDFTAISFPLATPDANGFFPLDANGDIVWDRSVIYHPFENPPASGDFELRQTVFTGNTTVLTNNNLRDQQLASVVNNGDGAVWPQQAGEQFTTMVIADMLDGVDGFTITQTAFEFDGFGPVLARTDKVNFGSVLLTPGNHDFRFEVTGTSGGGFGFGIDSISISPSGCDREGEFYVGGVDPLSVATTDSGAALTNQPQLGWSGNAYLDYASAGVGDFVNLNLYYDIWRETNFQNGVRNNVILTGNDIRAELADLNSGGTVSWQAAVQSGSAALGYPFDMSNITVRNVISNATASDLVRVEFESAFDVTITSAYLNRRDMGLMNEDAEAATSATQIQLYFTTGANVTPGVFIPAGTSVISNWAIFPIAAGQDYFVTFHISAGNATYWPGAVPASVNSYLVFDPAVTFVSAANWPAPLAHQNHQPVPVAPPDNNPADECFSSPSIFVTANLEGWSSSGDLTSQIYDTQLADPAYNDVDWWESAGADITLTVSSSDNADMSGPVSVVRVVPGSLAGVGTGRYVQFRADVAALPFWVCINHPGQTATDIAYKANWPVPITCAVCNEELTPACDTPGLDNVTIDWPGAARVCDISGFFTRDPNYGIITLTVDGLDLTRGLEFDMNLSGNFRGGEITEEHRVEAIPRNTGN